jgi:hypothetical protein
MRRIGWFLLILGISLGTIFGLYYAWEIGPIDPKDAVPSDLQEHFQEELRTLIAIAYAKTGDLNRALRRLELLSEPGNAQTLKSLAQKHLADGHPEEDVRAVAQMAAALATREASPLITAESSRTITPTNSPTPPPTTTPIPTDTPTPIPAYQVRSVEEVCDPSLVDPLIQVFVYDSVGEPKPGVEVMVLWGEGEDHFFTGLKPEVGPGYGDFSTEQGKQYRVMVAGSNNSLTELEEVECFEDEEGYPGSWLVIFEEP